MHLVDFPLPGMLLIISILMSLSALMFAVYTAPWRALVRVPRRQHLLFAAILVLVILWSIKINWVEGFFLHPMGMTAATVIFGWRLAVFTGFTVLVFFELLSKGQWITMPVDYVFTVLLPATVTYILIRIVQALKSRNLFLFVLGVGFVGAMIGFIVNIILVVLLAALVGHFTFISNLWREFPIIIMLLNMEGFLNGAVVTAMSVFAPGLVKSFDDRKYMGD